MKGVLDTRVACNQSTDASNAHCCRKKGSKGGNDLSKKDKENLKKVGVAVAVGAALIFGGVKVYKVSLKRCPCCICRHCTCLLTFKEDPASCGRCTPLGAASLVNHVPVPQ